MTKLLPVSLLALIGAFCLKWWSEPPAGSSGILGIGRVNTRSIHDSDADLQERSINTIRFLRLIAYNARSGHPGLPMGEQPCVYTLDTTLEIQPRNPAWLPDRLCLWWACSMLLYSLLYLTGYDLSLDELKNFAMGQRTPGHPEFGLNTWSGSDNRTARARLF